MVKKVAQINMEKVTEELINKQVDEIYRSIESDNSVSINIGMENRKNYTNNVRKVNTVNEKVQNNINVRNKGLEDIIKILLIREYLSNNINIHKQNMRKQQYMNGYRDRDLFEN